MLKGRQFDVCAHTVNRNTIITFLSSASLFFLCSLKHRVFYPDAHELFQCLEE